MAEGEGFTMYRASRLTLIVLVVLSSMDLHGQWITAIWSSNGSPEPVSAIPWSKFTHVTHWAALPNRNGTINSYGIYPADTAALLVGGHTAGKHVLWAISFTDDGTWASATSPGTIATFVANITNFTTSNGYDGVDLDWEANINIAQFKDLIFRLRNAMPDKTIIMDVLPGDAGIVAAATQSSLDQVNMMCYDMWGSTSLSWHNASIYGGGRVTENSCDLQKNRLMSTGLTAAKMGMGIPFYGYRFTGVTGPLQKGRSSPTYFSYRDLVTDTARWQPQYQFYDDRCKANYLSIPSLNEFDSYNGVQFMSDAVGWARANGLGGFMIFTQDNEYLAGETGDARYPLSTALYNAVYGPPAAEPPVASTMPTLYAGAALLLVFATFVAWMRDRSHTGTLKRESN